MTTIIGPSNEELAAVLEHMAELLTKLGEPNPYRVQAYLQAAAMIREHDEPLAELFGAGGRKALMELPGIGVSISTHIEQYIETGRLGLRDNLLEATDPVALLASVPGLGEALAYRVVRDLGITTLTELERAAHDGRLARLDGFGPRRLEALRLELNSILHRAARRRVRRIRRQLVRLGAARRRAEAAAERAALDAALREEEAMGAVPEAPAPAERPHASIYTLFPPAAA
ncbi:MAG TPA: helix-hairpin-helix domain-containing protein [Rubricoccaceae bacterium]|nr:helix-hairpin-helix domain-containing protein [Rubricoccaceae bacterium]